MRVLTALAGLTLAAAALDGHHSTAPYDLIHGTIIEGIVTRVDWENPHAHISLDVTAEENAIEHWRIELGNPGQLRRLGWTQKTLKAGDRVTVTGGRAKNGSFNLRGVYIQLQDGAKLMCLPAADQ
jgi:Family of unknown function (DUF6152)